MRGILWLVKSLWAGGKGSLIGGGLLLVLGIFAAYFIVLPYFNEALTLSADDFVDLDMPSNLQRIKLSGELVDGDRRATVENELGYYGIIEMDNQLYRLLLVGSTAELDEDQTEFLGTLRGRETRHIEIWEDIVDAENLEGRAIEAVFVLGEPSQTNVSAAFIADGILLALGLLGLARFFLARPSAATA